MIRKIIKMLILVSWMIVIFSFSNDSGVVSTKKSDGFIINTIEVFLQRNLSEKEKQQWTTYLVKPVRKGAHLFVYTILGSLLAVNISEYCKDKRKVALLALFLSFLYACSDELHQLFIVGRSGQVSDVLLDTVGAGIGILIFLFVVRMLIKYEQKERIS